MNARHRRGFTLLEVTIATSIFLMALVLVSVTLQTNADQARFDTAMSEATMGARKVLQEMTRELTESGADATGEKCSLGSTGAANVTSGVTFQMRQNIPATGNATWGSAITYSLQQDGTEIYGVSGNGLDDDNDGVVDERALVRSQAGTPTVILDPGITFFRLDRDAGSNCVTITVEVSRGYERKKKVAGTATGQWARVRMTGSVMLMNSN